MSYMTISSNELVVFNQFITLRKSKMCIFQKIKDAVAISIY